MNSSEIKPKNNDITSQHLVAKDNELIMASYSISVEEQRLLLACMEKAFRNKERSTNVPIKVTLTVNEYAKIYSVSMSAAYRALGTSTAKLYERSIRMNSEGVRREVRWLQEKAIYDSGKTTLIFSSIISQHIYDIVTKRSIYRLEQATQLRSQHAIRLFEIFQIAINKETQEGIWEVSLSSLRDLLELPSAYDRWIDLRKRIIEESLRQINKNTSLKVDWEVAKKEGRQIVAVRFFVVELNQLSLGLD